MVNALAHFVTAVGASWGRSQEWLSCTRILWDSVHGSRSNVATQRDAGVVESKCWALQVIGLLSHLEQLVRVGRNSRFHMA